MGVGIGSSMELRWHRTVQRENRDGASRPKPIRVPKPLRSLSQTFSVAAPQGPLTLLFLLVDLFDDRYDFLVLHEMFENIGKFFEHLSMAMVAWRSIPRQSVDAI